MIPQGPIYFSIRTDVLSAYPRGCRAGIKNRVTFADWLLNGAGSYSVKSINSNEIVIIAAPYDISSALLTDVESLFNHCFEHLQEMVRFYVDESIRSDAWNVVTIYYFGFFAAQIFSRLIGIPTIYIGQEQIANFKTLGGISKGGPGAGSYRLEKKQNLSAFSAEYQLKRTNNQKIHEATWINVFTYLERQVHNPLLTTAFNEVSFYQSLVTPVLHKIYDGYGWPSVIRTKANYRAGFAYLEVDKNVKAKTKGLFEQWKNLNETKIVNILTNSISACSPADKTPFSSHVYLLHSVSQTLFILCRQLYLELLERANINKIWELHRAEFRRNMSFPSDEYAAIAKTF